VPGREAPGPGAPLPERARAYGRYCKTEGRTHVAGQKGTPIGKCVKGVAQMRKDQQAQESGTQS
jgi:hypothetical protein